MLASVMVAVAVWASQGHAAPGDEPAPRRDFTLLEAGPFGRADLVAEASVQSVRDPAGSGRQIVIARLEQVFKPAEGVAAGREVAILVAGPRVTRDASKPSIPALAPEERGRFVFFLAREPAGQAYRLDSQFRAEGLVGEEKLQAVAGVARLARIEDETARARATLAWGLERSEAEGIWTRVNAARELGHLATVRPGLFDGPTVARLQKILAGSPRPQREWLEPLLTRLGGVVLPFQPAGAAGRPTSSAAWRAEVELAPRARREALIAAQVEVARTRTGDGRSRALADLFWVLPRLAPAGRAALIDALADARLAVVRGRLRDRYGSEPEVVVREAIVRALGWLGEADDVAWVAERADNPRLRTAALLALARIRTPAARAHLVAWRARCAAEDDEAARRLVPWIDHLLGDLFDPGRAPAGS